MQQNDLIWHAEPPETYRDDRHTVHQGDPCNVCGLTLKENEKRSQKICNSIENRVKRLEKQMEQPAKKMREGITEKKLQEIIRERIDEEIEHSFSNLKQKIDEEMVDEMNRILVRVENLENRIAEHDKALSDKKREKGLDAV